MLSNSSTLGLIAPRSLIAYCHASLIIPSAAATTATFMTRCGLVLTSCMRFKIAPAICVSTASLSRPEYHESNRQQHRQSYQFRYHFNSYPGSCNKIIRYLISIYLSSVGCPLDILSSLSLLSFPSSSCFLCPPWEPQHPPPLNIMNPNPAMISKLIIVLVVISLSPF